MRETLLLLTEPHCSPALLVMFVLPIAPISDYVIAAKSEEEMKEWVEAFKVGED